jgi:phenylalanyl-tRNA synthetase alpha subunit
MKENEILKKINNFEDLKREKSLIFGQKGSIAILRNELKLAPNDQKKVIGQKIQQIKENANKIFDQAIKKIENEQIEKQLKNE